MKFEYLEARTIQDAISLLTKYDGKAKLIAGGTDLVVQMKRGMLKPEYVINLAISDLNKIRYEDDVLLIGALTTIRALQTSDEIKQNHKVISEAASQLASIGVRNIATVGGNLCNASPSADMAPILIALGTKTKIVGPDGERYVPLEGFFTGPGVTVMDKNELLVLLEVPEMNVNSGAAYLKYGIRGSIDLAIVGVAALITLDENDYCQDAKIVLGAVGPTPIRARKAEEVLKGKKIEEKTIKESAKKASQESQPITDVRASAEYRIEMVEVFTRNALKEAFSRIKLQ